MDAFCNCGSGVWLQVNKAGDDVKIVCNTCRDRWCVPCQSKRAAQIRESLTRILHGKTYRHIVLTLRASNTPLKDQLDRLNRSFQVLRRRDSWKQHVEGGVAVLELKVGEGSGMWHPHLHILCEGSFYDQKELSNEWHAVTGDSSITWICRNKSIDEDAGYLTKYITKSADASVFQHEEMFDELVISLRGRRLCTTFGSWRGIELEPSEKPDGEWLSIGRVDSLISKAKSGDVEALRWVDVLIRKYPLFSEHFNTRPDPPGDLAF